tara:strand:+ start:3346 stop:3612 length:267 start_codon:yes stop_codon:yes gene_type:complete
MAPFDSNHDEIPPFSIPEATLLQLFELTGSADSHKGFVLAYVNEKGSPVIFSKTDSQIVEMGLHQALQQFLEDQLEARGIEFPPGAEE